MPRIALILQVIELSHHLGRLMDIRRLFKNLGSIKRWSRTSVNAPSWTRAISLSSMQLASFMWVP
jgi:hypothetical protein